MDEPEYKCGFDIGEPCDEWCRYFDTCTRNPHAYRLAYDKKGEKQRVTHDRGRDSGQIPEG